MLPVIVLRFRFTAPPDFHQQSFPEAAWRGAFGYALKRAVCLTRQRTCAGCAYEYTCAYPFIFETRPGPASCIIRSGDRTPHPFILRVPATNDNTCVEVEIVLIGTAATHLPVVIHSVREAARRGIGKGRHSLVLDTVVDPSGAEIWRPGSNLAPIEARVSEPTCWPDRVTVTLVSPLRLVRQGEPITPETLDGPTLAFAAVRRVGLLAGGFGGGFEMDFKMLKAETTKVRIVDRDLAWVDRRRFSTRQERLITYGGLTGQLTLELSEARGVTACLETCQTVHVGKGATFGYGQIAIAAA